MFRISPTQVFISVFVLSGCGSGSGGPDSIESQAEASESIPAADGEASVSPVPESANRPGDWPRWRGPNLDGISRETGWQSEWAESPAILWTANVGTGFSSFAVQDGRVYTMGHVDGNDTIWCYQAQTGDVIWAKTYPCELVANLHEGGPAATPTLQSGRVYTLSKEGHFFCRNAADGAVIWKRNVQADLDLKMPTWGFAGSPLIWNDLVIVEAGRLAAFDKLSGEPVWKTAEYKPGYGSPVAFRYQGQDHIATLNNDGLLLARAADGGEIAHTKWESDYDTNSTTPIVSGDAIFISTGYNRGCALFRLAGDKLEAIYENKNMSNHMNNCVLWQGHLYGINGNAHNARNCTLRCLEFATGELKWEQRGFGCGSLMMADEKLIVLGDGGELAIAEASPDEFRPLARAQILTGKCWTVPVLSHGLLYARNAAGDMVCVDLR